MLIFTPSTPLATTLRHRTGRNFYLTQRLVEKAVFVRTLFTKSELQRR